MKTGSGGSGGGGEYDTFCYLFVSDKANNKRPTVGSNLIDFLHGQAEVQTPWKKKSK